MTSSHLFFNNVFAETYPELIDLEESFANLRISHMPNLIINKNEEMDNESEINHDETEDSHEEEENDYETEILSKEQLKKFTNVYFFEGIEICKIAFRGIYGISEKRWKNIRSHFDNFDIQPRTHSLTGRVGNKAIL